MDFISNEGILEIERQEEDDMIREAVVHHRDEVEVGRTMMEGLKPGGMLPL